MFYFGIKDIICGKVSGMCSLRFTQKYLLKIEFYNRTFKKQNFDFFKFQTFDDHDEIKIIWNFDTFLRFRGYKYL